MQVFVPILGRTFTLVRNEFTTMLDAEPCMLDAFNAKRVEVEKLYPKGSTIVIRPGLH